MSNLSRFMHTAREILDEHDRAISTDKKAKDQPPFFVRTTWLFVELEELTLPNEADIFAAIKVARIRENIAGIAALLKLIEGNTATMPQGQQRHERGLMCQLIREQIVREPVTKTVAEEACPGHVASASDPKFCGRCGVHIDSLRPDEDEQHAG